MSSDILNLGIGAGISNLAGFKSFDSSSARDIAFGKGFNEYSSNPSTKGSSKLLDWLDNSLTGNRDFDRELKLMQMQMDYNSQQNDKAWAREMEASNTSYQRAVKDLIAAGLNPYLAYQQGGSGTPSLSAASVSGHHAGQSGQGFSSLLGTIATISAKLILAGVNAGSAANVANIRGLSDREVSLIRATSASEVANTARESHVYHYGGKYRHR